MGDNFSVVTVTYRTYLLLLPQLTIISCLILVFSFTEVRQLTYPRAYE